MAKFFCVLGLDSFGSNCATSLFRLEKEVLVIDRDPNVIQRIAKNTTKAVCADVREQEVLTSLGVPEADVAIIGMRRHFDVTVLAVHYLHQCGVKKIVAHVDTDEKAKAIKMVGATDVVFPERDAALRLSKSIAIPGLVEQINVSEEVEIVEVLCPPDFVGKTLIDIEVRQKYNVHIIGVKHAPDANSKQGYTMVAPPPTLAFKEGDKMLALGKSNSLAKFTEEIAKITVEEKPAKPE